MKFKTVDQEVGRMSEQPVQFRVSIDLKKLKARLCKKCKMELRKMVEEQAAKQVADQIIGSETEQ